MLTLEFRGDCKTIVDWVNGHAIKKLVCGLHKARGDTKLIGWRLPMPCGSR